MSIESLKCKECGTAYELGASYVCENCFGPLEVAYDYSELDPVETKRRIQAGSAGIWRYADFLPFSGRPAHTVCTNSSFELIGPFGLSDMMRCGAMVVPSTSSP